ncbi:hypothetical protein HOT32_gp10 [Erwinia phage Faunus]|uniref:Uncharacterized protein n=1 Tax=Erwinia phage Faunus TaxID=2182346 RepID=A0A2U8UWQ1_9CAUD|nr:hypothetical protein HOT32_gp10 [Erwinia phage Faunus]AWN08593.1 hypothetical protein [Erwinia phage Faunus]
MLPAPIKVGDLVVCRSNGAKFNEIDIYENKAYKVVATEMSAEKNRISFGVVSPNPAMAKSKRPGFFIIDDDGCKRFCRLGEDNFSSTVWEKISNRG